MNWGKTSHCNGKLPRDWERGPIINQRRSTGSSFKEFAPQQIEMSYFLSISLVLFFLSIAFFLVLTPWRRPSLGQIFRKVLQREVKCITLKTSPKVGLVGLRWPNVLLKNSLCSTVDFWCPPGKWTCPSWSSLQPTIWQRVRSFITNVEVFHLRCSRSHTLWVTEGVFRGHLERPSYEVHDAGQCKQKCHFFFRS